MMPLWMTVIWPVQSRCGWALRSFGRPCVAQRVWARPMAACGVRSASLAELAAEIPMLPQQQRAVTARHKDQWEGDPTLQRAIAAASARLGASGRVLVRPSGTEPALRVMVEGPDEPLVTELADSLAALAGERLN